MAAVIAAVGAASAPARSARFRPGAGEVPAPPVLAVARLAWPSYLGATGFMLGVTTLDVVVPAQLSRLGHDPAHAGLLLGVFALTGTVGGLVYGSRNWPGSASRHALLLVLVLCAALGVLPLLPGPWAIAALLAVAGLAGPPALIARSLTLQARLPATAAATGFSGLSAVAGLGASLAGMLAAPLLRSAGPAATLVTAAAVTALAALVGAAREARPPPAPVLGGADGTSTEG
ncbi:hypothetical protein [Blastococcus montanus]|uniref:hypothetical protein n=1 Tax=Blastococcus montanus TaxID=3144973 RepID=UPI00320A0596